jgi:hypothetical protein
MTTQEIQRAMAAKPFEPFRLLVADGRSYDVRHPEHLAFSGKGKLIAIGMEDDSFVTLDLLLVAGLQKPIPRGAQRLRR